MSQRCDAILGAIIGLVFVLMAGSANALISTDPPTWSVEVPITETYTIRSGVRADWLWNRFRAQGRPMKEWPDFWRASCDASGIPCTTEAWRKIRAGTLITIPRRPEEIAADERARHTAVSREEVQKRTEEIHSLFASYTQAEYLASLTFFLLTLCVALAIGVVLQRRNIAMLTKQNFELRLELMRARLSAKSDEFEQKHPSHTTSSGNDGSTHCTTHSSTEPCFQSACTQAFHPDGSVIPADNRDRTIPRHCHHNHGGHQHSQSPE